MVKRVFKGVVTEEMVVKYRENSYQATAVYEEMRIDMRDR
jgi:hypothetical protein